MVYKLREFTIVAVAGLSLALLAIAVPLRAAEQAAPRSDAATEMKRRVRLELYKDRLNPELKREFQRRVTLKLNEDRSPEGLRARGGVLAWLLQPVVLLGSLALAVILSFLFAFARSERGEESDE